MSIRPLYEVSNTAGECEECHFGDSLVINPDGFLVCGYCGAVQQGFVPLVPGAPQGKRGCDEFASDRCVRDYADYDFEELCRDFDDDSDPPPRKKPNRSSSTDIRWGRITCSINGRGRYKPIFHWNERISQLCLTDPPLPTDTSMEDLDAGLPVKSAPAVDVYKILSQYIYEETPESIAARRKIPDPESQPPAVFVHGEPREYTRSDIISALKATKLQRYCERWKTILCVYNETYVPVIPSKEFLSVAEKMYLEIERVFWEMKCEMPKSHIRSKDGIKIKERHNIIPFNYLFRKICEAKGVWDFHRELPLLRSNAKLRHLDDIMEVICEKLCFPFRRTAIMKMPKIKRQNKK